MKAGSRSWRRRERRPTGSLLPKPVVAESLLDRLIDTRHEVRMDGPTGPEMARPMDSNTTHRPEYMHHGFSPKHEDCRGSVRDMAGDRRRSGGPARLLRLGAAKLRGGGHDWRHSLGRTAELRGAQPQGHLQVAAALELSRNTIAVLFADIGSTAATCSPTVRGSRGSAATDLHAPERCSDR